MRNPRAADKSMSTGVWHPITSMDPQSDNLNTAVEVPLKQGLPVKLCLGSSWVACCLFFVSDRFDMCASALLIPVVGGQPWAVGDHNFLLELCMLYFVMREFFVGFKTLKIHRSSGCH